MNLPALPDPAKYSGLYVFDFGTHVAVGYTAEEIAVLQQSEAHGGGQAYHIHSVTPDGYIQLRGVTAMTEIPQAGLIFFQDGPEAAREDFEDLKRLAMHTAPPCPLHWHLASDEQLEKVHFTVMIYDGAHTHAVGQWLNQVAFSGGVRLDCGPRVVTYFRGGRIDEKDHVAIAPDRRWDSRPRDEVLATVERPIQREL